MSILLQIFASLILTFWAWEYGEANIQDDVQLTSINDNFMSLIAGFTARLQCSVAKCARQRSAPTTIAWFKDDVMIFNGTNFIATSGFEPSRIVLQRQISHADDGRNCVTEEFSLLLKNLTRQDAGEFRCQLLDFPQQLDFHLDVLDSGLKAGFHQNFSYDYVECCLERGISPLCRAMCKPRDMDLEFFDPTSCKTNDYKNFLECATDGGRRDYVPCCRQRAVPTFCYDFCSNNFQMLKRSHRLCLYYLPEIFSCFSKQYALYPPSTPSNLRMDEERLCWRGSATASLSSDTAVSYAIHIKTVPDMMLKSSASIINDGKALAMGDGASNRAAESGDELVRNRRKAIVLIAHDSTADRTTNFVEVDPNTIEQNEDEICVQWRAWLRDIGGRHIVYLQASNEYGASEPSQPLFVTTPSAANAHFHHA